MRRSHPCSRSRAWQEPRIFCGNAEMLKCYSATDIQMPPQTFTELHLVQVLQKATWWQGTDEDDKTIQGTSCRDVAMSRCRALFFFLLLADFLARYLCPSTWHLWPWPAVSSCTCRPGHLAPSATSIASDQPRAEGYHCEMVPSNPGHDRSLFSTLLDPIGNPKQSWQILTLLEIKKKNQELIRSFCFCVQWFLVNDYYKYQGSRMCSKSRHSKDIHCQRRHSNCHLARKQQSTTVVWCGQGKVHQRAQNWHHLLNKVASFASYGESALQFVLEKWWLVPYKICAISVPDIGCNCSGIDGLQMQSILCLERWSRSLCLLCAKVQHRIPDTRSDSWKKGKFCWMSLAQLLFHSASSREDSYVILCVYIYLWISWCFMIFDVPRIPSQHRCLPSSAVAKLWCPCSASKGQGVKVSVKRHTMHSQCIQGIFPHHFLLLKICGKFWESTSYFQVVL